MECRPVYELPGGDQWQYELKLDGYRAQAIKAEGEVRIYSRRGHDFQERFPHVLEDLRAIRCARQFILDGELVAIDAAGRHSFQLMQRHKTKPVQVEFFTFDILHWDGKDLERQILSRRRALIEREIGERKGSTVRLSPILRGDSKAVLEGVKALGFEGVVAKRLDFFYEPGDEPGTWVKLKTERSEDFVVGGFIGSGIRVDELLVGRKEGGKLLFMDSVKNGFVAATRREVLAVITPLKAAECPFANLPEKKGAHKMDREKMKRVTWVRPVVLAEIAFNEVTSSGHLRHSKFLRIREESDTRGQDHS